MSWMRTSGSRISSTFSLWCVFCWLRWYATVTPHLLQSIKVSTPGTKHAMAQESAEHTQRHREREA